jgi:predicted aldo/keto reductase-like oxidoreductase
MRLDGLQTILSGMSTIDQIKENVATFEKFEALNDAQSDLLRAAADAYRNSIAAPCTGCRYCVDGCPQELDIPELLNIYNSFKVNGPFGLTAIDSIDEDKTPKNCISCGSCVDRCPQGLEIPEMLGELAKAASFRI